MDKILRYFTENKLLVNIIIITIVILGSISMLNLKQDLYPTVSLNMLNVKVIYPGASTKDVELNAVIPIERELKKIRGIKKYTSVSTENSAIIFIEIDDTEGNVKEIKDKVFRELNNVSGISKDIEEIEIEDLKPEQISIYEIGIYPKKGSNLNEKKLNDFVDYLEDSLQKLSNVSDITKVGYRDREIKINVFPEKMNKYQIALNEIVNSIKERNVRITGGTLQSSKDDKTIVTIGQFVEPMEVKDVIIRSNFEENQIRIDDIADIEDGFKKPEIEVKINSNKGITLLVEKKAIADLVKTSKQISNYLKDIKPLIPEGIKLTLISDSSSSTISLLNVLKINALIGFILVVIVLYIFLSDIKTAFWTAFTIPITIMLTFFFMNLVKYSFNIVTLAGMITVLGMLVDHGIIISEIIDEYKSRGFKPLEAVIKGIKDVITPISLTIITTILAFIPMYSIKGLMGKFIYAFPTIVIFCLLASFFDATFMLPNHLMTIKKSKNKKNKTKWIEKIILFYEKILKIVLKFRYIAVGLFICIFILTIILSWSTIKNFVLFDDDSADLICVQLEAPPGTSLSKTTDYTKIIEDIIYEAIKPKELISVKTTSGHHIIDDFDHRGFHENWALIEIHLVPKTKRKRNADIIINELREKTNKKEINEFEKIAFKKISMGPPVGEQVDIKIISDNPDTLNIVKNKVQDYLASIDGIIDIDNDQKQGKDELKIDFDYNKMARLGVNVETVAVTVRTAYEGYIATSIQGKDDELDFRVKIDDSFQKDMSFLENLLIPSEKYMRLIKLKDIAKFSFQKSKILTTHYNGDKMISITAKIKDNKTTPANVINMVKDKFKNIEKEYQGVYLKFAGEAEETKETLNDLILTFVVAVLLIYFVLILLFKSLGEPLIIMVTIPFGIIGSFLAFIAHNVPFTFLGIIGIIGLSGVVVNDSIVMVEFIKKSFKTVKNKNNIINTITNGAKRRLRPVIMTTLTTVVGLLPTAYGIGGYNGMLVPITLAISYGILFASLLTLFFIPSLYIVRLDIIKFLKVLFKK